MATSEFPPKSIRGVVAEVMGLLREKGESVCVAETVSLTFYFCGFWSVRSYFSCLGLWFFVLCVRGGWNCACLCFEISSLGFVLAFWLWFRTIAFFGKIFGGGRRGRDQEAD